MTDFVFNICKGRAGRFAELPDTSDKIRIRLYNTSGWTGDSTAEDDDSFTALASHGTKCDSTGYPSGEKTTTGDFNVTSAQDDTANSWLAAVSGGGTVTWSAMGGATAHQIGHLVFGYDQSGAGTDSGILPMTHHDFVVDVTGTPTDIVATINTFFRSID